MCTYGVLPACVNVTWLYLCLKKQHWEEGVVASTFHKASLQRLPSKYTTKTFKKKKFRTGYWLFRTIKSKLTNWASNPCFYWLHFHNVNKIVILLYQYLNIWDSFFPIWNSYYWFQLMGVDVSDAFWIPFYQQLSSKNSSLLPTWSSSWWGSKSSNQGWEFH